MSEITLKGICSVLRLDMVYNFVQCVVKKDKEAAAKIVDKFGKLVSDENLSLDRVYNADESTLFGNVHPEKH